MGKDVVADNCDGVPTDFVFLPGQETVLSTPPAGQTFDVGDSFDDQGEGVDQAAARELEEECGLSRGSVQLIQLHTFGAPDRDPRTRVVTVTYLAVLPPRQREQVQFVPATLGELSQCIGAALVAKQTRTIQ